MSNPIFQVSADQCNLYRFSFLLQWKKEHLITAFGLYCINHYTLKLAALTETVQDIRKKFQRLQRWSLMSEKSGSTILSFQKADLPENVAARYSNKLNKN